MGKIGIYGGSFNPPHLGHILAVREFAKTLELDKVLLIPAAEPPHKAMAENSPDAQVRLSMLSLAAQGVSDVEVSDMELRRNGPSYTVDTVRALHAQYPNDKLYLLMGSDMFLSFDQWFMPGEICKYAIITAAHRSSHNAGQDERMRTQAKHIRETYCAEVILIDNQYIDVSSTTVRRMLLFDCAQSYLAPQVLQMIQKQGLYGTAQDLQRLPFEQLKKISLSLHDPKRVPHVIGCCETAARLARRWGADETLAARAGVLHDVTKALDKTAQLLLCEKYGIIPSAFEQKHYKLLHSKSAAAVAKYIFGECDAVCEAVFWHTTGKADMNLLEKILYLADYMEPNRDFDGVQTLRTLADTDLDAALLCGFEMSIELLKSEGKALDRYTVEARDYLLRERTKHETIRR